MRVGLTASSIAHGAVLVLALVSFSAPSAFDTPQPDPINVDVISASDLSQMTKGNEKGKKTEVKKVVAEKVDAPKPVNDPNLKVSEKQEIEPTAPPPPPPPPPPPTPAPPRPEEPKPPAPTPPPKPEEPKPAPPKADKPPPEQKADEGLKADPRKDEQKQEAKAQTPPPLPQRKPPPPPTPVPTRSTNDTKPQTEQKFDADRIAALLDKRTPQRNAAADQQVSQTAALGAPSGAAQTLTQSEIDALRARIQSCWGPPAGASEASDLRATIVVSFKQDGSLAMQPQLSGVTPASSPYGPAFADSAMRAIIRCAPYTFLPANKYAVWKEIEMGFSLRDMLGRAH